MTEIIPSINVRTFENMRILRLFTYRKVLYTEAILILLFFTADFFNEIILWCPSAEFFNSRGGHIDYACISLGFLVQRFAGAVAVGYIIAHVVILLIPSWRQEIFKFYSEGYTKNFP